MSSSSTGRSMAASPAFLRLSACVQDAGGSDDLLREILWRIGAHPLLVAHDRVFSHLLEALRSDVFTAEALTWAGPWRESVTSWIGLLELITAIDPELRQHPELNAMFREPRNAHDHPMLHSGVGRHPLAAALFNSHEASAVTTGTGPLANGGPSGNVATRFLITRAHVLAVYFEARSRAAHGLDTFMRHDSDREFAPAPMHAGAVGLALRQLSLNDYSSLLVQLPDAPHTLDAVRHFARLYPDFSGIRGNLKEGAARYFQSLQSYLTTLPTLINRSGITDKVRTPTDRRGGAGGREPRPGWVGFGSSGIWRFEDRDWDDGALPLMWTSIPGGDEADPLDEEADGDAPWSTRDDEVALFDTEEIASVLSMLRFMQLAYELHSQEFGWSLDVASMLERAHAMRVAQAAIDQAMATGSTGPAAQHAAAGGLMVKAAVLYGWQPATLAAVRIRKVDRLDKAMVESLCFIRQECILLIAVREGDALVPAAFLLPATTPQYKTKLTESEAAAGRPRQLAFLLPDVKGLGKELLDFAIRFGRLAPGEIASGRVLGIETSTANRLAKDCLEGAQDPINQDPRARLTIRRLSASLQAAVMASHGDAVAGWQIRHDAAKSADTRVYYTQLRAARLPAIHAEALRRLDGFLDDGLMDQARSLGSLQDGWVGCRSVVALERARSFLDALQKRLEQPIDMGSRSQLRAYHNDYILLAWLTMALPLGLRAASSGYAVIHQLEARRGLDRCSAASVFGLAEKHNSHQDKSRLLPLPELVASMVDRLEQHNAAILHRLDLLGEWRALDAQGQRLFIIKEDESLCAMQAVFIKDRLAELGLPVGVNFGRALLRTEWLDQDAPARCIDAALGHFGRAQNWYGKNSSHDPVAYVKEAASRMAEHIDRLGLRAVDSRCIRASERALGISGGWRLPAQHLKPPTSPPRPRSMNNHHREAPSLPEPRAGLWLDVRRNAAVCDRVLLSELLWFMTDSQNAHARVLLDPTCEATTAADENSACELEHEVLMYCRRHRLPKTQAASWLRLLSAAQGRLQQQGVDLVRTKQAAINTHAESPVSTSATLKLPDLVSWQATLYRFVRAQAEQPTNDQGTWTVAIGLSAAIHGMALDLFMLTQLFDQLAMPGPRRLKLCAGADGFSFMTFDLPSSAPGGRQRVQWFLDPLTELLILRAPPFETTPTLRGTSRAISAFLRRYGNPAERGTGSWRQVRSAAKALWSTRVPPYLVQIALRTMSTTALVPSCFSRVFQGCELKSARSGAVLNTCGTDPTVELTLESLTGASTTAQPPSAEDARRGHWAAAGADVDFVTLSVSAANAWLQQADAALRRPHGEVLSALSALRDEARQGSFARGALAWLSATAASLIATADSAQGDPMFGLRRVASTFLPHLAAECGDAWLDGLDEARRSQVLNSITHELESGASRQDLKRGLKLLLQHEESLQPLAGLDEDIEDPSHDASVDARVMTVDEYEKTLRVIQVCIDPPLSQQDREDLTDILQLGVWSGARPREYLALRLGDIETTSGGAADLLIREYDRHTLKTPQATRRVPLSLLAPTVVLDRIAGRVQSMMAELAAMPADKARQQLLFAQSKGTDRLAHHNRQLALLRQILRQVTGDPKFRVYSLRHTWANWLFMALESDGSVVWTRLWQAHPATLKHLSDANALRQRLLDSTDRMDRRAMLAITKLAGHLAGATSFMHYIHTACFLQLQAVFRFAEEIPKTVLAAAAGISPATYSEQALRGLGEVLRQARSRAGWTPVERVVATRENSSDTGPKSWLSFDDLCLMLRAKARHEQPTSQIAVHFGRSEAAIEDMISGALEAANFLGAEIDELEDADRLVASITETRMNEAERTQLRHLCQNIEDLHRRDPELVAQGIAVIQQRTTRLHHEVALDNNADAQIVLKFLHACAVAEDELQIVLRRRVEDKSLPSWLAGDLGPYAGSTIKLGAPDTRTSDATLHRWVRLRLVDRAGHAISKVFRRAVWTAQTNIHMVNVGGH